MADSSAGIARHDLFRGSLKASSVPGTGADSAARGKLAAHPPSPSAHLPARLLFAGWALALAFLTLAPAPEALQAPGGDKLHHLLAFLLLGLLARLGWPRHHYVRAWLPGLLVYGAAIELVQGYLPWRSAELADLAADGAGLLLVSPLWWLLFRGRGDGVEY